MHPVWTHETRILCDLVGTYNRILAVIQLCHRTVF